MTPELKTACEVVFQEHKLLPQIKWNRDAFRGRISIGLSEMAKETLVKKNIIYLPNKSKRIITLLNPDVLAATSFEEAETMIKNKTAVIVTGNKEEHPVYIADEPPDTIARGTYSHRLLPIDEKLQLQVVEIRWYMKPLFYYFIWPLCALVAGAFISWLLDFIYSELFLSLK
jgi:hypothetical protein